MIHANAILNSQSNDSATREERLSVNITFLPLQRVLQQKPKYYVAIYGNAIKSPNRNNLEVMARAAD
jgi:hypothetical protein